jgi:TolA-binding protein
MKLTLSFLAVAIVAALPGPLFAQSRQDQQLAASMLMIQEQQQQTALAVAQLAEMIKAMNPRFDEVVDALRKQMAGLEQTIKNVGPDISAIRSQSQDNATRIGSLKDEVNALSQTINDLLQEIAKLQVAAPPAVIDPNAPPVSQGAAPGAPLVVPPAQTVTLGPRAGMTPQRLLEEARADYQAGRFSVAITGFEQVVQLFPTSQAAAEAQLLIGRSHASESRWPEAIAAYDNVILQHAKSPFVPEAYYQRGLAESTVGQPDASRASFEHVVKNYPDSEFTILAKQRLAAPRRP